MKRPKPNIESQKLYTVKEICALLFICPNTLRQYTKKEVIVPIRVSAREIYYKGEEIERLYEAMTTSKNPL